MCLVGLQQFSSTHPEKTANRFSGYFLDGGEYLA